MFPGEELKASPKKEVKKEEPKEVSVKFDYRGKAGKVQIALSCRGWKPDIDLEKVGDDLFSTEVVLKIIKRYYINLSLMEIVGFVMIQSRRKMMEKEM